MRIKGDFDFEGNKLQRVVIATVENFPASPSPGMLIFKDKRAMMCVEISSGIPVWVPLTNEISTYIHTQTELSSIWVVEHNFNSAVMTVQVIDENNLMVYPDSVDMSVLNQITITFGLAMRGKAVLMLGEQSGLQKPVMAYSQEFTNESTIIVNHGLGYQPIARVFISGFEVQPESIVHDSTTQLTITFSAPETGVVRCI